MNPTNDNEHPAEPERCAAAHPDDRSACEGPADAVRIVDPAGFWMYGCVRHGAVLLACLERGRVLPGSVEGAAIEVYQRAQTLLPFAFGGSS